MLRNASVHWIQRTSSQNTNACDIDLSCTVITGVKELGSYLIRLRFSNYRVIENPFFQGKKVIMRALWSLLHFKWPSARVLSTNESSFLVRPVSRKLNICREEESVLNSRALLRLSIQAESLLMFGLDFCSVGELLYILLTKISTSISILK